MGIWAASMSGNALLTDDLAAQRLKTTELPEGVDYGLGIFQMGDWYGHSGEVFGWEAIELHAPESGATMVVATNACAGATTFMLNIVNALYPGSMPQ
jgi:D-alanyl-D-alanine carboxypeptidase